MVWSALHERNAFASTVRASGWPEPLLVALLVFGYRCRLLARYLAHMWVVASLRPCLLDVLFEVSLQTHTIKKFSIDYRILFAFACY